MPHSFILAAGKWHLSKGTAWAGGQTHKGIAVDDAQSLCAYTQGLLVRALWGGGEYAATRMHEDIPSHRRSLVKGDLHSQAEYTMLY